MKTSNRNAANDYRHPSSERADAGCVGCTLPPALKERLFRRLSMTRLTENNQAQVKRPSMCKCVQCGAILILRSRCFLSDSRLCFAAAQNHCYQSQMIICNISAFVRVHALRSCSKERSLHVCWPGKYMGASLRRTRPPP